jgi:hypothetical protein
MSRSYGTVSPCGRGRQFLGAKNSFSPAYVNFNLMEEQRVRSNFVGATFYMEKEERMAAIRRVLFRGPASGLVSASPRSRPTLTCRQLTFLIDTPHRFITSISNANCHCKMLKHKENQKLSTIGFKSEDRNRHHH